MLSCLRQESPAAGTADSPQSVYLSLLLHRAIRAPLISEAESLCFKSSPMLLSAGAFVKSPVKLFSQSGFQDFCFAVPVIDGQPSVQPFSERWYACPSSSAVNTAPGTPRMQLFSRDSSSLSQSYPDAPLMALFLFPISESPDTPRRSMTFSNIIPEISLVVERNNIFYICP